VCGIRFEAIALSNLVIKLAMVPLTVVTQREAPKMAVSSPEAAAAAAAAAVAAFSCNSISSRR
jgi:membrane protein insertase Oxa1/YidC/SpoIIIJ